MPAAFSVLQLTDMHLFPSEETRMFGVNTCESFRAVLHHALGEQKPDILLATGDIAQVGERKTYELFLRLVGEHYDGPLLCVPGNHDLGATFDAVLPCKTLEAGGWRLVPVDTHIDNQVAGEITNAALAALDATLKAHAGPTLVVGHHAPVRVGASWLDEQRIDDGAALVDLLKSHPNVKSYLFGHIHQQFDDEVEGVRIMATPSTCFQFEPRSNRFSIDGAKPGYRRLELNADGTITTWVTRLADFELTLDLTDTGY